MRTIFLADAHLHQPEDANYRLLCSFIRSLQGNTETLCLLGDIFDFRVGLPSLSFPEHEPVLEALRELRSTGTRLIYLEGNHDFHLRRDLQRRLGAEVYPGPVALQLQGKQIMLCHGDLINRADWRYRLLHRLLRHPATFLLGRLLPPAMIDAVRRRLQRASKARYRSEQARWDRQAIIRRHADDIRTRGYDALVLGHFHLPFLEQTDGFTLVALGDWITRFSYAELCDGRLRLTTCDP